MPGRQTVPAIRRSPGAVPASQDGTGPARPDLGGDVRQSIARIKASPFLLDTGQVRGFVFDVATGRLREVA